MYHHHAVCFCSCVTGFFSLSTIISHFKTFPNYPVLRYAYYFLMNSKNWAFVPRLFICSSVVLFLASSLRFMLVFALLLLVMSTSMSMPMAMVVAVVAVVPVVSMMCMMRMPMPMVMISMMAVLSMMAMMAMMAVMPVFPMMTVCTVMTRAMLWLEAVKSVYAIVMGAHTMKANIVVAFMMPSPMVSAMFYSA